MKEKLKQIKEDLKDVVYIGDEGSMATSCKTKRGAWIKFRKQVREDCGEDDAEMVSIDDIMVGYAHLPTRKQIEEWGTESDFFISVKPDANSIRCWWYNI